MKSLLILLSCSGVLGACTQAQVHSEAPVSHSASIEGVATGAEREPAGARVPTLKNGQLWNANDPALKQGDLTVWKLQEMAQQKQFTALNNLFNHGVSLDSLPLGYSAGTGARVLDLPTELGITVLDSITGRSWRGKIFFQSHNSRESHGLNRINDDLTGLTNEITPMAAFTTSLVERHFLVPEVTSNFVILNYAHPKTKPYWLEVALLGIQVFDVMVAVPGKYGPVYIGKTWLGNYDQNGNFSPFDKDNLIAWYFLDFNSGALNEQLRQHWDQSVEKAIKYKR